jgi:dTDP-4-amino-4,6-dideoxygalactose transaminase
MPVHCYGNPCDVERIQEIADRYGLRVIYDAAHAFNIDYKGGSLLLHGDVSVLSFHATKVFNTFEGGAIICRDEKTKRRIDHLKNFGFVDETVVAAAGINGKMNELQAAFGLLQLRYVDKHIEARRHIDNHYRKRLSEIDGIRPLDEPKNSNRNYSYFPVLVEPPYPLDRDALYQRMRDRGILTRRYFYPLITDFPMYRGLASATRANLPVASEIAEKVLCLPIYPDLTLDEADRVIESIHP